MIPDHTRAAVYQEVRHQEISVTAQLDDHISSLLQKCSVASPPQDRCSSPTCLISFTVLLHANHLSAVGSDVKGEHVKKYLSLLVVEPAVDAILQKFGRSDIAVIYTISAYIQFRVCGSRS
jgi:hypothetical protein